jgi:hypothetical protein
MPVPITGLAQPPEHCSKCSPHSTDHIGDDSVRYVRPLPPITSHIGLTLFTVMHNKKLHNIHTATSRVTPNVRLHTTNYQVHAPNTLAAEFPIAVTTKQNLLIAHSNKNCNLRIYLKKLRATSRYYNSKKMSSTFLRTYQKHIHPQCGNMSQDRAKWGSIILHLQSISKL